MVLLLRRPPIFLSHDELMFLLPSFVDKALLDTMLQYDAILLGRFKGQPPNIAMFGINLKVWMKHSKTLMGLAHLQS